MITLAALFSVFPLMSMLSAALQPQGIVAGRASRFPADPQWHNFVDAWNLANITVLLKSSIIYRPRRRPRRAADLRAWPATPWAS